MPQSSLIKAVKLPGPEEWPFTLSQRNGIRGPPQSREQTLDSRRPGLNWNSMRQPGYRTLRD
jgi:hypothetical protein